MIKIISRPLVRLSLALILTFSMFSLATPATAFGMSNEKSGKGSEAASDSNKTGAAAEAEVSSDLPGVNSPNINYILYASSISFEPQPLEVAPVVAPPKPIDPKIFAVESMVPGSLPTPPPPRASTAPMTAGEKFNYFLKSSFVPPGPYAQSVFNGMFNELFDNNEGKKDTVGDYFADSLTRAARSFGNRVANNFFEKFALATIFKQDPRYHRSGKSGAGAKISHAVTRVFVTQGDRSGDQFNISFLLGGLLGAGVSNVWAREENQTVGRTFSRWGTHIGLTMLSNVVREFVGGQ
ncbi:MAG TPA: hypothetical protein VFQ92_16360 [Blastocatellia bacterium]|nr:hypothetical protein [Blastocatellia bacterium]